VRPSAVQRLARSSPQPRDVWYSEVSGWLIVETTKFDFLMNSIMPQIDSVLPKTRPSPQWVVPGSGHEAGLQSGLEGFCEALTN
jgi:hypothetical protein